MLTATRTVTEGWRSEGSRVSIKAAPDWILLPSYFNEDGFTQRLQQARGGEK